MKNPCETPFWRIVGFRVLIARDLSVTRTTPLVAFEYRLDGVIINSEVQLRQEKSRGQKSN